MEIWKRERGGKVGRESIVGGQTTENEENNKEQSKSDGNVGLRKLLRLASGKMRMRQKVEEIEGERKEVIEKESEKQRAWQRSYGRERERELQKARQRESKEESG